MTTLEKIKALIVDDEAPGRSNLQYALAEFSHWEVVGCCESAEQARSALRQQAVDVIFLDIQMPQETGLALARSLSKLTEPPLIIFVTAFNDYAVEAFEVHALDYLLKPFDDQRLAAAIERAQLMLEQRQRSAYGQALRNYVNDADNPDRSRNAFLSSICVRSIGKIETINLDDVLWIGAAGNYLELHTGTRTVLHRQPISQIESKLDPAIFIRVHRSVIVRRAQISTLMVIGDGAYKLRLHCADIVPVSERHVDKLRELMA